MQKMHCTSVIRFKNTYHISLVIFPPLDQEA